VKPIKRAGGRRYYRPEDIDLLKGIRALLYREGYTIKGAQKVMRDQGVRFVADMGRETTVKSVAFSAPVEPAPQNEPRHARAVLAVVERAHSAEAIEVEEAEPEIVSADAVANEEHARLEALLAELVQMKSRLRAAMPQRAG
jgi:DNA-binding transcriptional MerR regulator